MRRLESVLPAKSGHVGSNPTLSARKQFTVHSQADTLPASCMVPSVLKDRRRIVAVSMKLFDDFQKAGPTSLVDYSVLRAAEGYLPVL